MMPRMKRFPIFLFCLHFLFSEAQEIIGIDYSEYLNTVLKQHPMAKRAENEQVYADYQLKAARGLYDPVLNGEVDQKLFNGKNYFTQTNAELKQALFTAQYIKFGYDYGQGLFLNPENNSPTAGLAYVGIELGLGQGLMIDKRRAEVLKSRAYVDYHDAEKNIRLNHLLFESSQAYFDYLFNLKIMALNTYFMQLAKQRLTGIEALAAIGEKASVDTIEAAIFYQSRLSDWLGAKIENQKMTQTVLSYWWSNAQATQPNALITVSDSLEMYFQQAKKMLTVKLYEATPLNPVINKYRSLQKVLDIDKRYRKELVKPIVNVKYNALSNSAVALYPGFMANNYKFGMQVSFPLLFRNPLNTYHLSKIQAQNNQWELLNKSNELTFKISALRKNMGLLAEQLQNAERTARYSKQLVEAEKLKFTNGESTLFMLNTRESKWLESEQKLAEFKLKFIKNYLNLVYLSGGLDYVF
jgi:outer membrane protein TolC